MGSVRFVLAAILVVVPVLASSVGCTSSDGIGRSGQKAGSARFCDATSELNQQILRLRNGSRSSDPVQAIAEIHGSLEKIAAVAPIEISDSVAVLLGDADLLHHEASRTDVAANQMDESEAVRRARASEASDHLERYFSAQCVGSS